MNPVWTPGMVGHGERAGRRWRIVFASVLLSFAAPTIAEPCGAIFVKHEPDAAERQIDRQPPAQVAATGRILRGARSDGSCAGVGFLEIEITGAKTIARRERNSVTVSLSSPARFPPGSSYRATRCAASL